MFHATRRTLFASLMLCGLGANAAQVEVVAQATITQVDNAAALAHLELGSTVTLRYVYESTAEDSDPSPEYGNYPQYNDLASYELTLGNTTFKSPSYLAPLAPPDGIAYNIFIAADETYDPEHYGVWATALEDNNNVQIHNADMYLDAAPGVNVLDVAQLTTAGPDLAQYTDWREIYVHGYSNGQPFTVTANVDSLTSQVVMPAPGTSASFTGTARVTEVMDGPQVLSGHVAMHDLVTFEFTVNHSVPDSDPQSDWGRYIHSEAFGTMKVTLPDGTVVQSTRKLEALVSSMAPFQSFGVTGYNPVVTGNAFTPEFVDLFLQTQTPLLSDDSMPLDKLNPGLWELAELYFGDWMAGWHLRAQVLNIESVAQTDVVIAPGDGTFHPAQRFDAAIRHTMPGVFTSLGGTLNGENIDTYLQGCVAHDPVDNMQTLVCPDTHQLLVPGTNTFTVDFLMPDQSTVSESVTWEVQP